MEQKIIDKSSYVFALIVFVFSFIFIFFYSTEFLSSIVAALMTAALSWSAYVIVRLTWLTLKK